MAEANENDEQKKLAEELAAFEEFKEERERLKKVIGQIGGVRQSKRDSVINGIFFAIVILLLIHDLTLQWYTQLLSLEIGLFLVSFKIIFMIHQNAKVNHFQFWILNAIEFRLNSLEREFRKSARDN